MQELTRPSCLFNQSIFLQMIFLGKPFCSSSLTCYQQIFWGLLVFNHSGIQNGAWPSCLLSIFVLPSLFLGDHFVSPLWCLSGIQNGAHFKPSTMTHPLPLRHTLATCSKGCKLARVHPSTSGSDPSFHQCVGPPHLSSPTSVRSWPPSSLLPSPPASPDPPPPPWWSLPPAAPPSLPPPPPCWLLPPPHPPPLPPPPQGWQHWRRRRWLRRCWRWCCWPDFGTWLPV